ncbi:MAG: hypothetical protein ABI890_15895 [Lapillicoccus sp.]
MSGDVQVVMECEPVLDYGREKVRWDYTNHLYHQAKTVAAVEGLPILTLTTDMRLGFEGGPDAAEGG